MNLKKYPLDIQLIIGSIITALYFITLYLLSKNNIETILSGVLRELVTIPFIFLSMALLIASLYFLFVKTALRKPLLLVSLLINGIISVWILSSFF
jgi:hypothetical protein